MCERTNIMSNTSTGSSDLYSLLGCARNCSYEDLRQAYRRCVLLYHPDKQQQASIIIATNTLASDEANSSPETNMSTEEAQRHFMQIQAAWEILRDETKRKEYDAKLKASDLEQRLGCGDIAEEVEIDTMEECEDAATGEAFLSHPCRCGGSYDITLDQLHEGFDTVQCNGCSLYIAIKHQQQQQQQQR